MIQAELRYLHSADALDMHNYVPDNSDYFCISVQAMIGLKDGLGEESFAFLVCTPRWLSEIVSQSEFIIGRHYLFVLKYDYDLIEQTIRDLCHQAKGEDWNTVAKYLAHYGFWEFEDYNQYLLEYIPIFPMLQAELHYLLIPDAMHTNNYTIDNLDHFCISVQAMIAIRGRDGLDCFEFFVCTPSMLSEKIPETGFILGRHYLFILKYDYDLIEQIIKDLCDQAKGEDWETIGNYLARYGSWKFKDSREK